MSELKQHKTGSYLCYSAGRLRILSLMGGKWGLIGSSASVNSRVPLPPAGPVG